MRKYISTQNLLKSINATGISVKLKMSEIEALSQYFDYDEIFLLLFSGITRDRKIRKVIFTNKNLFFVFSGIFHAIEIDNISLNEISDIQEQRGVLFSRVNIVIEDFIIELDTVQKAASSKLLELWFIWKEQESKFFTEIEKENKIKFLSELRDKGTITEEEYELEKKQILSMENNSQKIIKPALILSEKTHNGRKRRVLKFIGGFILLIIIANAIKPFIDEPNANYYSRNSASSFQNQNEKLHELTTEQIAERIVKDTFGEETNWGEKRILSITSIPQVDGTLALDLRLRINDNLNNRYIVIGYLMKAKELMYKLFLDSKLNDYNEFRLYGIFLMEDIYGNVREEHISKIFFKRILSKKINWNNLTADNFHNLLRQINDGNNCTYWIHGKLLEDTGLH